MARLKYDPKEWAKKTPFTIQRNFSEKEIRAAYKKYRSIFRSRLKEFAGTPYEDSDYILDARAVFDDAGTKADIVAITHRVQELARWLGYERSTLSGMQAADQKTLETLQAEGYTSIRTQEDLKEFGGFMKAVRPYFDKQNPYTRNQTVQLYDFAKANNISIRNIQNNFEFYRDNIDKVYSLDYKVERGKNRGQNRKRVWTAEEIKERIGQKPRRKHIRTR